MLVAMVRHREPPSPLPLLLAGTLLIPSLLACDDGLEDADAATPDAAMVLDAGEDAAVPDPRCDDGRENGDETGVDCGGSCPPCDRDEGCAGPADCASGVCGGDERCEAPACGDGVVNGDEACDEDDRTDEGLCSADCMTSFSCSTDDVPLGDALDDAACREVVLGAATLSGPILLDRDVVLRGAGAETTELVDAEDGAAIVTVESGVSATLEGLTIRGGEAVRGAAIDSEGEVTLRDVRLVDNTAMGFPAEGGAIHQRGGRLTLTGATELTDNSARSERTDATEPDASACGGAIYAEDADLVIEGEVVLRGNEARAVDMLVLPEAAAVGARGGAICQRRGTLAMADGARVEGNRAVAPTDDGDETGRAFGGGFFLVDVEAAIGAAVIARNEALVQGEGTGPARGFGGAGGLWLTGEDGTTSFVGTIVRENRSRLLAGTSDFRSSGYAGGVVSVHGGPLTMTRMELRDNTAVIEASRGDNLSRGGGLYTVSQTTLAGSVVVGNSLTVRGSGQARVGGWGGGIAQLNAGTLTIRDCEIRENELIVESSSEDTTASPYSGGGIYSNENIEIVDTAFVANGITMRLSGLARARISAEGGAVAAEFADVATVRNCEFSETQIDLEHSEGVSMRAQGGALYLRAPGATSGVENTTFADNEVLAGFCSGAAFDGGSTDGDSLPLRNVTIVGTRIASGGGAVSADGPLALGHVLIADNTAAGAEASCVDVGEAVSTGHNLLPEGGSCTFADTALGDLITAAPIVGALADNGGPTRTVEPASGSPAVDGGAASCPGIDGAPLTVDQRGEAREDAACDIGALER